MLSSLIRCKIRSGLIKHGQLTCSELVRTMGLDPVRHKGTIHGFMVDLEDAGVLTATRKKVSVTSGQLTKSENVIASPLWLWHKHRMSATAPEQSRGFFMPMRGSHS